MTERRVAPKFIDGEPPKQRQSKWGLVREALRQQPGRWAEVLRLPKEQYPAVNNAGVGLARGHVDIEKRIVTEGAETVLYARAAVAR